VAAAITLGIASIAILGYTATVARDRELGVFQRLRVTPAPTWAIMVSRLAIQILSMLVMAVVASWRLRSWSTFRSIRPPTFLRSWS
jgi:ABC-2 type transport system permease protein